MVCYGISGVVNYVTQKVNLIHKRANHPNYTSHFQLREMNLKNLPLLLLFARRRPDVNDVNVSLLQPIKTSRYSLCSEV